MPTFSEMLEWCKENDASFAEAVEHFKNELPVKSLKAVFGGGKDHVTKAVPKYAIELTPEAAKFAENWTREQLEEQVAKDLQELAEDGCDVAACKWFHTMLLPGMSLEDEHAFSMDARKLDDGGIVIEIDVTQWEVAGEVAGQDILIPAKRKR